MSKRPRRSKTPGLALGDHALDGGAGHRHGRLEHLLLEELNGLLRGEVTDPRLDDVAFSRIELSVDYASARVWYVVVAHGRAISTPDRHARQPIEAALGRATGFLRARLAEQLDLKRCPTLRFLYDPDISAQLPPDPGEPLKPAEPAPPDEP